MQCKLFQETFATAQRPTAMRQQPRRPGRAQALPQSPTDRRRPRRTRADAHRQRSGLSRRCAGPAVAPATEQRSAVEEGGRRPVQFTEAPAAEELIEDAAHLAVHTTGHAGNAGSPTATTSATEAGATAARRDVPEGRLAAIRPRRVRTVWDVVRAHSSRSTEESKGMSTHRPSGVTSNPSKGASD